MIRFFGGGEVGTDEVKLRWGRERMDIDPLMFHEFIRGSNLEIIDLMMKWS